MAEYIGIIKPQYVIAISELEADRIIDALVTSGDLELAEEITDIVYGECDCDCGDCV